MRRHNEVAWIVAELERDGLPPRHVERLLDLIRRVMAGRGITRSEARAAWRQHITSHLLARWPPEEVRRRLPGIAGISEPTARRWVTAALAQRTARAFAFEEDGNAGPAD